MQRKTWLLIFGVVISLHVVAFLVLKDHPVIPPEWLVDHSPPEPNFHHAEARFVDPETGEKMLVREFTIPSKLAQSGEPLPK